VNGSFLPSSVLMPASCRYYQLYAIIDMRSTQSKLVWRILEQQNWK